MRFILHSHYDINYTRDPKTMLTVLTDRYKERIVYEIYFDFLYGYFSDE